ncbi:hypothetical protein R50345_22680 [Paenibacillus sp. FSL R5-0345]|uniref:hypothetical protein n=1 Tax=Paenibacillus sp. FSL R5-0345 TaxID=1536770 RepID=UPI0004F74FED|nr:hypothetical protein [Paenibacillus sp. FSL R5-0345]AIQ37196.1 hypothetical protein R50345_22680 [Paenibacillus sp. FSL R5-0345]
MTTSKRLINYFIVILMILLLSACGGDSKKGAYEYAVTQAKEAFAKPLGSGVKTVEKYSKDMVEVYKEHDSNIYSVQFKISLNNGQNKTVAVSGIRLDGDHWTYTGMRYQ